MKIRRRDKAWELYKPTDSGQYVYLRTESFIDVVISFIIQKLTGDRYI